MANIEHSERDDAAVRVAEALWPERYAGDVTTAEWERCYAVVDAANDQLRGAVAWREGAEAQARGEDRCPYQPAGPPELIREWAAGWLFAHRHRGQ